LKGLIWVLMIDIWMYSVVWGKSVFRTGRIIGVVYVL
jgi:hypothetical protein